MARCTTKQARCGPTANDLKMRGRLASPFSTDTLGDGNGKRYEARMDGLKTKKMVHDGIPFAAAKNRSRDRREPKL